MKTSHLTRIILQAINEKNPQSVEQLKKILKESYNLPEDETVEFILKLQAEGIIELENQTTRSRSLTTYLKTSEAIWYWITIMTGAITVALVFTASEQIPPWFYARNVLGVIFVLFLPGYSLTKLLMQSKASTNTSIGSLETIERIALSIGMSIASVSIVGLLLYFSPWGLDLTIMVASLFIFTSVFATTALIREYLAKKN